MALKICKTWRQTLQTLQARCFRSDAALEALTKADEDGTQTIVLYNYPSFSGSYSALFAHLFHLHLNLPCLILPFSSVEPFRIEDLCIEGLKQCYFLDFSGSKRFAAELAQRMSCEVIVFDHQKSVISRKSTSEDHHDKLRFCIDKEKSTSSSVYEYFSTKLSEMDCRNEDNIYMRILNPEEQGRVEMMLKYLEDVDFGRWNFPDVEAFSIGLRQYHTKLNCLSNPHMYQQLLLLNTNSLIAIGSSHILAQKKAARKFLDKTFKVRLGRGFYGECLGVRIDENPNLADEVGKQLSIKSSTSGLRPIGAVVYAQRNKLKMCLRSVNGAADTSEIAKAYGGGGSSNSSSFVIRMDEYNQWRL